MCVRLTDLAIRLNDRAPAAPIRLKQCAPEAPFMRVRAIIIATYTNDVLLKDLLRVLYKDLPRK